MSNIVDRLRGFADLFEAQQAPHNLVLHMRAGADEIERLRAGGCARDQGTTQYCAEAAKMAVEIASLLNTLADTRTENMRLRAALESRRTGLRVVMVAASLLDQEDLPDEPSVILCGSIEAIRNLGGLLGDRVDILPTRAALEEGRT